MLCNPITASSQMLSFIADTTFTNVGLSTGVRFNINSTEKQYTLSGIIHLSNPTVFYPKNLAIDTGSTAISLAQCNQLNDSTYQFSATIQSLSTNFPLVLFGEALAGNDSICILKLDSLRISSKQLEPVNTVVLSRSVGTPLPYVRFATLEYGFPNPSQRGTLVQWAYRIDKESSVRFRIYNGIGRLLRDETLNMNRGVHRYSFTPDLDYSSGIYTLVMETNSGTERQRFVIVN